MTQYKEVTRGYLEQDMIARITESWGPSGARQAYDIVYEGRITGLQPGSTAARFGGDGEQIASLVDRDNLKVRIEVPIDPLEVLLERVSEIEQESDFSFDDAIAAAERSGTSPVRVAEYLRILRDFVEEVRTRDRD
jgi:hypothetical protein